MCAKKFIPSKLFFWLFFIFSQVHFLQGQNPVNGVFTVSSISDDCFSVTANATLRCAIEAVNSGLAHTIQFDVTGTITIGSTNLPQIFGQVNIIGNNAVTLDGSNLANGYILALGQGSSGSVVEGLRFINFPASSAPEAIQITGGVTDIEIKDNYFQSSNNATAITLGDSENVRVFDNEMDLGANTIGVRVDSYARLIDIFQNNIVGGREGIRLAFSTSGITIRNNVIRDGTVGILAIEFASNVLIERNRIYNHSQQGIHLSSGSNLSFVITENEIYCNGGKGIQLSNGASNEAEAPTITGASNDRIVGLGDYAHKIEVFLERNSQCGPTQFCQGKIFLGSVFVTDDIGIWSLDNFSTSLEDGDRIVATQTINFSFSAVNLESTSEFSDCYSYIAPCTNFSAAVSSNREGICTGETATLTASGSGGAQPYSYFWDNELGTGPVKEVSPTVPPDFTTYAVTVVDANGCSDEDEIRIFVTDPPPTVDAGLDVTVCGPDSTTLNATATGGTPPYNFAWDNRLGVGPTKTVTPSESTTYTVFVRDAFGCTHSDEVVVSVGNSLDVSLGSYEPICAGDSVTITATARGGDGNYTYQWEGDFGNRSTITVGPMESTNYTVTVNDGSGCSGVDEVTILVQTPSTAEIIAVADSICLGDSVRLEAEILTGTGPYIYQWLWEDTMSNRSLENLEFVHQPDSTTLYILKLTDGKNCITYDSLEIAVSEFPLLEVFPKKDTICRGDSILLEAMSCLDSLTYPFMWSTGDTTNSIKVSPQQDTFFIVTLLNADSFPIGIDTAFVCVIDPLFISSSLTQPTCDQNNGTITLSVSGGSGNYTYNWSSGQTTASISNLGAGTYTATISDDTNCSAIETFVLEPSDGLTLEVTNLIQPSCDQDNGAITIQVSGGTGNYTYEWNNGQSAPTITNLESGIYIITANDDDNCSISDTITLNDSNGIRIERTNIVQPTCDESNGAITITVTGGNGNYTYDWNTGQTTPSISELPPGNYIIAVNDTDNCFATDTITLEGSNCDSLFLDLSSTNTSCNSNDGIAWVTVSGGTPPYNYNWSNGATTDTIFNISSGIYNVLVEDASGLQKSGSVEVSNSGVLLLEPSSTSATCELQNGMATVQILNGNAPYTYAWDNGSTEKVLSNVGPGVYTVTVEDDNGCLGTIAVTVANEAGPTIELISSNNPACDQSDGSIEVNVTGGTTPYEFIWSNGANTSRVDNLPEGDYQVNVRDQNGCTDSLAVRLDCGSCSSVIGTLSIDTEAACEINTITATYDSTNQVIGGNHDVVLFILSSDDQSIFETILQINPAPEFNFDSRLMDMNTEYYVSALIGNREAILSRNFADSCLVFTDPISVRFSEAPSPPSFISATDTLLCPGSTLAFETESLPMEYRYHWKTPMGDTITEDPFFEIANFQTIHRGNYSVAAGLNGCISGFTGPIEVDFSEGFDQREFGLDTIICGQDSIIVELDVPSNAEIQWLPTIQGISIESVSDTRYLIKNLATGSNKIIVRVYLGSCFLETNFSIYYVAKPVLEDDEVTLSADKNILKYNLLSNDSFSGIDSARLQVSIVEEPASGLLVYDDVTKTFSFNRPESVGAFQDEENVEFTYQVCNADSSCELQCDMATVRIKILYDDQVLVYPDEAFRPKGSNPIWDMKAARNLSGVEWVILDRWGRSVYEEENRNPIGKGEVVGSWLGTTAKGNEIVPAGVYYLMIREIDNPKNRQSAIIYLIK